MVLDEFLEAFTNREIRELAQDVATNEITPDREQRLVELLAPTTIADRQAAAEEAPAIVDLLVNLGLEFRFPDEEPREPPQNGELADRAIELLARPDGFEVLLREFTDAGLRGLSDELATGQTTADQEDRLREFLGAVNDATLRDAVEDRRALESVLAGLGMPVPEPERGIEPESAPAPEPASAGGRRREPGRPSPFGAQADKEIARRFFAGDFRKGNAWMAAEKERLSRFPDMSPRRFWEVRGADVWGGVLDAGEFVQLDG